jgi:hypothetical protein
LKDAGWPRIVLSQIHSVCRSLSLHEAIVIYLAQLLSGLRQSGLIVAAVFRLSRPGLLCREVLSWKTLSPGFVATAFYRR